MNWMAFFVFVGGGLGALARYGMVHLLPLNPWSAKFPYEILCCNLIGCFLIGLLHAWVNQSEQAWLSPLLVTGFLGGFTTFSSFGLEVFQLYSSGFIGMAFFYFTLSTFGGCGLIFLAHYCIKYSL